MKKNKFLFNNKTIIWKYQHIEVIGKKNEQNKLVAFKRAINFGFGIETDIRDFNGKLVISHDLPNINSIKLLELLKLILKSKKKFIQH